MAGTCIHCARPAWILTGRSCSEHLLKRLPYPRRTRFTPLDMSNPHTASHNPYSVTSETMNRHDHGYES